MPKKKPKTLRETDLYEPIRDYLVAQGYAVQGEVKDCDVTARKGDDLIVIELKRSYSVDLLIQGTRRQRITDSVYVALPRPEIAWKRRRRWSGMRRLLRQLELGLILVDLNRSPPVVAVDFHPLPYRKRKLKRDRRAIIEEMAGRSGDYNRGGSVGRKLTTAYRENAIRIACCLEKHGPLAPRQLRALGTGPKTQSILSSNFYGWFVRIARALYAITTQGKNELKAYADLKASFLADLKEKDPPGTKRT